MTKPPRAPDGPRRHPPLRVAVASDQSLVADSVQEALGSTGSAAYVVPWSQPRRPRRPAEDDPDVLLLICDLTSAVQVHQAQLLIARWHAPTAVLTSHPGEVGRIPRDQGEVVMLPDSLGLAELVPLLEALAGRHAAAGPLLDTEPFDGARLGGRGRREQTDIRSLSPREDAVVRMLHRGVCVAEIAGELDVSPATVRTHIRHIFRKLGVDSQLRAVRVYEAARTRPRGDLRRP